MTEPLVCIGMPASNHWVCRDAQLAIENCTARKTSVLEMCLPPCSILDHCFNQYWAEALNQRDERGATHFAMIHSDVCPQAGWLDVLLDELTGLGADMVSAIVPLKDDRGLTSTAAYDGDPWDRRRLSLTEVHEFADDTFSRFLGSPLLLNTGLWLCDLRKDWCDDWHFQTQSRIVERNGRRVAEVLSEDWAFSHFLNQRGASIYATRKINLRHVGQHAFTNSTPWGAWKTDQNALEAVA